MLGVLITLLLVLGCAGIGLTFASRWMDGFDPAAKMGLGGLLGLGLLGTATFFIGIIPTGFHWGIGLVALYGVVGLALLVKNRGTLKFSASKGPELLALLAVALFALFSLVSVLAPSTMDDWDTLAYHLAVPKQWLADGHIHPVPSISHSNFPDVIDDLYVWGLAYGGASGAKAFSLGFFLLGAVAIFGLARQRYGAKAGWWATLAFAASPTILWEAGTSYIDVGHGLFAGLGIALAAMAVADEEGERKPRLILAGLLLGLAAASKYTGLETLFIVAFAIFAFLGARKRWAEGFRSAVLVGVLAVVVAAPWYVKNQVLMHNAAYPFLYEKLGGKDWDQRRADIYRNEQQTFGVGGIEKKDPLAMGHAVLGLGYQPGRYVNPGQTIGLGSPTGAIGIAILAALVIWPLSGRRKRFEGLILVSSGLTLFLWFFLSQQSRYITTLAPPAAILLGGAVALLPLGRIAAVVAALQTVYSLYFFYAARFSDQVQVVIGKVSAEEYQAQRIPFYEPSQVLNQAIKTFPNGKVALYDEVFGYLLDIPYMWANPGHSTIIPYDSMANADDYVREMKKLGFTHIYISLSPVVKPDREYVGKWLASMGLQPDRTPLSPEEREKALGNWQEKWQILLADAAAQGKIHAVQPFRSGILFSLE